MQYFRAAFVYLNTKDIKYTQYERYAIWSFIEIRCKISVGTDIQEKRMSLVNYRLKIIG